MAKLRFATYGLLAMSAFSVLGVGCQTYLPRTGQTLPSGYYLEHPAQAIPPSPVFPLPNELTTLQEVYARQKAGLLPLAPQPAPALPPAAPGLPAPLP